MAERLSFKRIASEALDQFNLEKGLFRTFVDLMIRPGQMLHGYLDGSRRNQYVGVMTYLFLAVAITVSFMGVFDPNMEWHAGRLAELEEERIEVIGGYLPTNRIDDVNKYYADQKQMMNAIYLLTHKYPQQIAYISIPIIALATMLFFRFWKFNFAEHLTINAFIAAQQNTYINCLVLLMFLFPPLRIETIAWLAIGLLSVYRIWIYMQVSKNYRMNFRMQSIPRSLFAIGSAVIIQTVIGLGVVLVLVDAGFLAQ